jgi:hypothetical protein
VARSMPGLPCTGTRRPSHRGTCVRRFTRQLPCPLPFSEAPLPQAHAQPLCGASRTGSRARILSWMTGSLGQLQRSPPRRRRLASRLAPRGHALPHHRRSTASVGGRRRLRAPPRHFVRRTRARPTTAREGAMICTVARRASSLGAHRRSARSRMPACMLNLKIVCAVCPCVCRRQDTHTPSPAVARALCLGLHGALWSKSACFARGEERS